MNQNAINRRSAIQSLIPEKSEKLLDIGCGPISASYPYADKATFVTCVDWELIKVEPIPSNIECYKENFTKLDLPIKFYDTIIVADVFEHILLEEESLFIKKCISVLKPGGHIIISVPHKGKFAYLDPYKIKPAIHRLFWYLGFYNNLHNGSCDIRKGHKHYFVKELTEKFKPLELLQIRYWGYFFDPLLSWITALTRGANKFINYDWLEKACLREFNCDYGEQSFNVALKFRKPNGV